MFSFFKKDPIEKLNKKYQQLMKEARDIQRSGDLRLYAVKIEAAELVAREIEKIKAGS